ncbi:hypothetical protein AB0M87_31550 [Streptomyces sp. NPDC051320]|uniref:hypothetical protein n=1 Tax=Streptomyces sp. NPDC051320 TaxID=3154644 RepID=UPI003419F604
MDDPMLTERELVRDRFPAARVAFPAGSVLTDSRTPTSDLDIVVLLDGSPAPNRENAVPRLAGGAVREAEFTLARHVLRRHAPCGMPGLGASLRAKARKRRTAG